MEDKPQARKSAETRVLRSGRTQGDRSTPWSDVVVAILSVNSYSIEKVYSLFNGLEAAGLFDPRNLARWDRSEFARMLGAAGYNRGEAMTAILVERLSSLGALAGSLESNERILATGTKEEVADLLARVRGVGPVVLANYFLLRG